MRAAKQALGHPKPYFLKTARIRMWTPTTLRYQVLSLAGRDSSLRVVKSMDAPLTPGLEAGETAKWQWCAIILATTQRGKQYGVYRLGIGRYPLSTTITVSSGLKPCSIV
jgi:hypothetical protein